MGSIHGVTTDSSTLYEVSLSCWKPITAPYIHLISKTRNSPN